VFGRKVVVGVGVAALGMGTGPVGSGLGWERSIRERASVGGGAGELGRCCAVLAVTVGLRALAWCSRTERQHPAPRRGSKILGPRVQRPWRAPRALAVLFPQLPRLLLLPRLLQRMPCTLRHAFESAGAMPSTMLRLVRSSAELAFEQWQPSHPLEITSQKFIASHYTQWTSAHGGGVISSVHEAHMAQCSDDRY